MSETISFSPGNVLTVGVFLEGEGVILWEGLEVSPRYFQLLRSFSSCLRL